MNQFIRTNFYTGQLLQEYYMLTIGKFQRYLSVEEVWVKILDFAKMDKQLFLKSVKTCIIGNYS